MQQAPREASTAFPVLWRPSVITSLPFCICETRNICDSNTYCLQCGDLGRLAWVSLHSWEPSGKGTDTMIPSDGLSFIPFIQAHISKRHFGALQGLKDGVPACVTNTPELCQGPFPYQSYSFLIRATVSLPRTYILQWFPVIGCKTYPI